MVRLNHNYGMTETVYLSLVRGARYTVEIEHAATEPDFMAEYGFSNCDWELAIGTAQGVVVDAPDHIVTKDIGWPNATFKAAGKHATLYLPKVELNADNDDDNAVDAVDDTQEETTPLIVAVNHDTHELTVRRVGWEGEGAGTTLKITKTGDGNITLKKSDGTVVLGENDTESASLLPDAANADFVLTIDGVSVGIVNLRLALVVSGETIGSDILMVKVVKSDIVIRKGDGVIAWLIDEDATHSGIDWGPFVTDIYNPGIDRISLQGFKDLASDQTKHVRLRLKKELFMARRVWAKVFGNMNGRVYALPSDEKPWNLFTTALDYRTANCNEFVRGQFRKAVADVYAELVSQEHRNAFKVAYYDGSAVKPLIGPRHLTLFLGPPEITVGSVNGMVAAEELYSQTHGVSDSFQHVYEGEVVDFWYVPLTVNRYNSGGGHDCPVCGRYPSLRWYLLPFAELMAEAHHSTITPAAIIESSYFETIPYEGD